MISQKNIQTEIDASYLYNVLAENEKDENIARIFREMSEIENKHARAFLKKKNLDPVSLQPSARAKILKTLGKVFGNDFILGTLLDTEKKISASLQSTRRKYQSETSLSDTAHVTILKNILESEHKILGPGIARFEKRHRSVGGNALRAAVLGGNDGLVSNFSLVMGIAGAAGNQNTVLLTGIAGLLAGALSMALGEWISVKSSQELYENQMNLEMEELETSPETEELELALIYQSKGIPEDQAKKMAGKAMLDKSLAHEVLVREELGINPEELKGSAMEAAISSFLLFAVGAIIPVIPFFFSGGMTGILLSAIFSSVGLFVIGSAITLFTGRSIWHSGLRQVFFGLAAAGITYGIGSLIGVTISG